MSPLRARFIQFLQLKGYTDCTQYNYVGAIIGLSRYHNAPPDKLTIGQIIDYLTYLRNVKKLSPRTINLRRAGIVTFCRFVSPAVDVSRSIPTMKVPRHLPSVLTTDEIERLVQAPGNIKHRAIIMLLYSAGLRLEECRFLKISDINSNEMTVRVRNGKGKKERYTILARRTLKVLRKYVKACKPREYLFEGRYGLYSRRSIGKIVTTAAAKARIAKRVHPHTLRHAFATHLLESGVSLQIIQRLLGHSSIKTTTIYTHISQEMIKNVRSPLDIGHREGRDE